MKPKNKLQTRVLCLFMLAFSFVCLTACDEYLKYEEYGICMHQWEQWSVIKNATCVEEGEKERACAKCGRIDNNSIPITDHIPNEDDGDCTTEITCSGCDMVMTKSKSHRFSDNCDEDCNNADCEYTRVAAHFPYMDDGDCSTPITCSYCDAVTTEAMEHAYADECDTVCDNEECHYTRVAPHVPDADDGDCTTSVFCLECGETVEWGTIHSFDHDCDTDCNNEGCEYSRTTYHEPLSDDGDCSTAVLCLICGDVITEAQSHAFENACDEDCNNIGCEHIRTATPHVPDADDGDCTTELRCSECGGVAIAAQYHEFDHACDTDCNNEGCEHTRSTSHTPRADDGDCTTAITCLYCGDITTPARAAHTGGTATCEQRAICEECSTEYGEYGAHYGSPVWIKHAYSHYRVYSCCYEPISSAEEHTIVGGACTECGFDPVISVASESVSAGSHQVAIAVSIADNPGIIGLMATVQYDSSVLTLTGATSGEAFGALTFTEPDTLGNGCTFMWDALEMDDRDIADGEFLILVFDVADSAPEGEYGITLDITAYDNNLNPVSLRFVGGQVTVDNN